MSRLLLFAAALFLSARPAFAQVCAKVLADRGGEALIGAPLWRYLADGFLSPWPLASVALAVLTVTKLPGLRGIALIAGLVATARASASIGENVYPDSVIALARVEGCGGAYLSSAIVSSLVAAALLGAFMVAKTESTGKGG